MSLRVYSNNSRLPALLSRRHWSSTSMCCKRSNLISSKERARFQCGIFEHSITCGTSNTTYRSFSDCSTFPGRRLSVKAQPPPATPISSSAGNDLAFNNKNSSNSDTPSAATRSTKVTHPDANDETEISAAAAIANATFALSNGSTDHHEGSTHNVGLSIYEMTAESISKLRKVNDLENLVTQVEKMPELHADDIGPLLMPLTRITSMKRYGEKGADLTQRLLLTCLARLPADIGERYASISSTAPSSQRENVDCSATHMSFGASTNLPYPPASLFNRAMIAWGNLASKEGAQQADVIFNLQLSEFVREQEYLQRQHAKFDVTEKTSRAESQHNAHLYVLAAPPDRRCYKSRIRAWAVSRCTEAPAKSYAILCEMEQLSGVPQLLKERAKETNIHPGGVNSFVSDVPPIPYLERPDLAAYNVVMSAYARAFVLHKPVALERIQKIIKRIDDLNMAIPDSNEYVLDGHSYVPLLQAYSKYVDAHKRPLPDRYAWEILAVLGRIGRQFEDFTAQSTQFPDHLEPFRHVNREQSRPFMFPLSLSWAYGVAVQALLKTEQSVDSLRLADDIVMSLTGEANRITEDKQAPVCIPREIQARSWPTQDSVVKLVEGWQRSGLPETNEKIHRLLQVVVTYTSYPRLHLLNQGLEEWSASGLAMAPNLVEALISQSFQRATNKFDAPNGQSYAIAMRTWLRSRDYEQSAHRIELLLQNLMLRRNNHRDNWYTPREVHLRYVFTGWLNLCSQGRRFDGSSGEKLYPAQHCSALITRLAENDWFTKHAKGLYALVIRAWAMQIFDTVNDKNIPNRFVEAKMVLNCLSDVLVEGEPLPAFACNWVLETSCVRQATQELRKEAYDTAIEIFQRCKHNARTFVLTFKALRSQVGPTMDTAHMAVMEDLVKQACTNGMLTQELVSEVVDISSPEMLQTLFRVSFSVAEMLVEARGNTHASIDLPNNLLVQNLPLEWSENAHRQRQPSRRPDRTFGKLYRQEHFEEG